MAAKVMLIRVRNELEVNLWLWRTDSTGFTFASTIRKRGGRMIESGDVIKSRAISPFILFRVRFCEETSYKMKYEMKDLDSAFRKNRRIWSKHKS